MARLFEQSENTSPNTAQRLAFGRAGFPSENITLANLLTWLEANLNITDREVVEIGGWNMNTTVRKDINSYVLPVGKVIIGFSVTIISDNGVNIWKLDSYDTTAGDGTVNGGILGKGTFTSPGLTLYRKTGGDFDGSLFDDDTINRGWILIEYMDEP